MSRSYDRGASIWYAGRRTKTQGRGGRLTKPPSALGELREIASLIAPSSSSSLIAEGRRANLGAVPDDS